MKYKKYWEIKNKQEDGLNVGEIYLYGDISDSKWWDEDITPKDIDNELKAIGAMDSLNIYVNSGGGSVFAGMAIYNILKRADAKVKNAYIDGLAASISSVIPLSADNVYIPENAMMMIHNPSSIAYGESKDFIQMANVLDKVKESIMAVYTSKTNLDEKKISKMMDAETWMTAKDAIEFGFATEIQPEMKVSASIGEGFLNINNQKIDISKYKNLPDIYIEDDAEKEKFINKKTEETKKLTDEIIAAQTKQFLKLRKKLLEVEN